MTEDRRIEDRRAQPPAPEPGWHLDKKVPLGLILAVLMQTLALVGAYYQIKQDIELIKADAAVLHQRDTQTSIELRDAVQEIRAQFIRMDTKLDRIIERSSK